MIDGLKQKFSQWWGQRNDREQKILLVGSIVTVCLLLYTYSYKPLADKHDEALITFEKVSGDYSWLKQRVRELSALGIDTMRPQETRAQMQASIEKYLAAENIQAVVEMLEQRGKYYFEVPIQNAGGDSVMRWIDMLIKQGYQVSSFRLENRVGSVTGRVIIQASA